MPYTLTMFFLWGSAMALIGVVVGWLLRSLTARSQVAEARSTMVDADEADRLRDRIAELEPVVAERDRLRMEVADVRGDTVGVLGFATTSAPDLADAQLALGAPVAMDDLTVVDGIGPGVAELCAGLDISTWRHLAETDVSTLRSMLADGGSRFAAHDPATWPQQAALLADGRWADFKVLADSLDGGR